VKPLLARLGVALLVAAAPVGVYLLPAEEHGPSYPKAWDARVLDEVAFVERTRGLTFEHPVHVTFLADAAFEEKVGVDEATSPEEEKDDERTVGMLRALGLVPGDFDLRAATNDLLTSTVLGVYLPEEATLYVRGTRLTPYLRSTVVHELTHALQDQRFGIEQLLDDAPEGAELGVRGLVEGDAMRVEQAYQSGLPEADQRALAEEEQAAGERADDVEVPAVLEHISQAPYVFGPWLLDVLVQRGDNAAVDAAFRTPPASELQLVDPLGYPHTWRPTPVKAPDAPAGATDVDDPAAFGQLSLFEVLGARLGHAHAWPAVQGWAGDSYVTYTADTRTCVAAAFRMTDTAAAGRLASALGDWNRGGAAEVRRTGEDVLLRACDVGKGATVDAVQPDAFEVLGGRVALAHYLVQQQQVPAQLADCVAQDVVRRLGDEGFAGAAVSTGDPVRQAAAERAFTSAVRGCDR
jgi:hypothetical protein